MKDFNHIHYDGLITLKYRPSSTNFGSMKKPHIHDSYEIYYLLDGERHFFIHDRTYHIKKGMIVLVKPSVIHRTVEADNPMHERLLLVISKSFLEDFVSGFEQYDWFKSFENTSHILIPNVTQQSAIREAMFQVDHCLNSTPKPQMNRAMLGVLETLMLINDIASGEQMILDTKAEASNSLYKRMSNVAIYINEYYMESLSLELIAKKFYFSTYYLSRNFKRITGFGLNEYINNVRILESEKLLRNTNMPISEVAQRIGFDSHSHYGRVFKKAKNTTPIKYRKNIQQIL